MNIWNREPVAILAIVDAAVVLVAAFGLNLTGEQVAAISAFASAILGIAARSQVTPVTAPDLTGDAGEISLERVLIIIVLVVLVVWLIRALLLSA